MSRLVLSVLLCAGLRAQELPPGVVADRILVQKKARQLTLLRRGKPLKSYRVALGPEPAGDKQCQGDNRTPEGIFTITGRNPQSQFHRSLRISYPDAAHRARARQLGCSPGGDIMIHGLPRAFRQLGRLHTEVDWTAGCVAVTNAEIEEIWRVAPNGTVVEIRP
jgi:murein L,D-transpeptidase YafK